MIYDRVGLRMASEGLWEAWETLEERVVGCRRAWNGSGFRKGLRRNALCSSEIVYCVIHSSGRKCNNWQHENRQQYKAIMNLKINSNKLNRQEKSVNRRQASERQLRTCMKKLWFEKNFEKITFEAGTFCMDSLDPKLLLIFFVLMSTMLTQHQPHSGPEGAQLLQTSSSKIGHFLAPNGPDVFFYNFFQKLKTFFFSFCRFFLSRAGLNAFDQFYAQTSQKAFIIRGRGGGGSGGHQQDFSPRR